jgi:transposase
MGKMTDHTIGVDISKSHLDVFRLEDRTAQRFDNSAVGFRALTEWLGKAPVARIVFEPTGPYHKAFEAALGETFPLVKVNPPQARRFAEAHGTRAKTDAVPSRQIGFAQSPAGQWMPGCWRAWGWRSTLNHKPHIPRKSLFSRICTLRVSD